MRNRERNQPAKPQIQERLEDRVWHRRQQAKSHELRIKGQRHERMLQRPGERYKYDRQTRTPAKNLEAGYQIAVIGHLLGQPPNERKHQHAIESGRQDPKEIRGRERPIQEPTDPIDATKNEYEANWDEREAEQRIADETRSIEADKSGTATLALRE